MGLRLEPTQHDVEINRWWLRQGDVQFEDNDRMQVRPRRDSSLHARRGTISPRADSRNLGRERCYDHPLAAALCPRVTGQAFAKALKRLSGNGPIRYPAASKTCQRPELPPDRSKIYSTVFLRTVIVISHSECGFILCVQCIRVDGTTSVYYFSRPVASAKEVIRGL